MVLPHISRHLYPVVPPHLFHSESLLKPESSPFLPQRNSVFSLSSTSRLCFSQPRSPIKVFSYLSWKPIFQLSYSSSRLLLFLIAIFFFTTTNMKTIPYFMSFVAPCTWELLILLFTLLSNKNICVSIYAKRKGEEKEGDNIDSKVSSLGDQVIKSSTSA